MSAARASGTDLASSLRQNTFLTLGVRPAGGPRSVLFLRWTGGKLGQLEFLPEKLSFSTFPFF